MKLAYVLPMYGAEVLGGAEGAALGGDHGQPLRVPSHQHERPAPRGEMAGEGESDAGRGAGDECGGHAVQANQ